LHPHISPLAPFIDPGSQVFDRPEDYGYRLFYRTLEEHRQALLSPTWSQMLSYETQWLSRQEIVDVTYEAAVRFNQIKKECGLVSSRMAEQVESRIKKDLRLIGEIDRRAREDGGESWAEEKELSVAATCLKEELQWPARSFLRSMPRIIWSLCRV